MAGMITFPDLEVLRKVAEQTPDYMHPNANPWAVILPGFLSDTRCEMIVDAAMNFAPYNFAHCGATTREFDRPLHIALRPAREAIDFANQMFWNYDIDDDGAAWMQTYNVGGDYPLHSDGDSGQVRKLTAVVMLTDEKSYAGGSLVFKQRGEDYYATSKQGTVAIFPGHVEHYVRPVTYGVRQSLNLGVYGPPFR